MENLLLARLMPQCCSTVEFTFTAHLARRGCRNFNNICKAPQIEHGWFFHTSVVGAVWIMEAVLTSREGTAWCFFLSHLPSWHTRDLLLGFHLLPVSNSTWWEIFNHTSRHCRSQGNTWYLKVTALLAFVSQTGTHHFSYITLQVEHGCHTSAHQRVLAKHGRHEANLLTHTHAHKKVWGECINREANAYLVCPNSGILTKNGGHHCKLSWDALASMLSSMRLHQQQCDVLSRWKRNTNSAASACSAVRISFQSVVAWLVMKWQ